MDESCLLNEEMDSLLLAVSFLLHLAPVSRIMKGVEYRFVQTAKKQRSFCLLQKDRSPWDCHFGVVGGFGIGDAVVSLVFCHLYLKIAFFVT